MGRRPPIFLAVVLGIGTLAFLTVGTGAPGTAPELAELTELQEQALATMLEANKLAIQLALLLFAAWGALLLAEQPIVHLGELSDVLCMAVSLGAAALALFCGYMQYDKIVEMLAAGFFDPNSEVILAPRELQLWSLLTGLVLLAAGAVNGGRRQALRLAPAAQAPQQGAK